MSKLLTFEYDKSNHFLEVHLNQEGLSRLVDILEYLKNQTRESVILLTPEWGDENGLTSEKQCESNELFNRVKFFIWDV
ncbi:MAG: Imm32 family immunity protein [Alphaproteobacteria bacterium]